MPLFAAIFIALVVDGMDLQLLSLCLAGLKTQYQLSQLQAGALGSYTFLGMAIGGMIAGQLSDRIGRVKVTMIGLVIFSCFTALLAFTQTYWQFAVIRFISGLGMAAVFSIGTLLVAEHVPTEKRGMLLGTLQAGWSIGYVFAALLSALIQPLYGWRPLFFIAIAPAAFSFLLLLRTKESAGFHAARQQAKQGNEYVRIWKNKDLRVTFLLWTATNIALQFGYFGANTWLPSYLKTDLGMDLQSMSLYVAGTYAAMVASKIASGFLADRFGRKVVWVGGGLATAVAIPAIVALVTQGNAFYLMVAFGFLYAVPYALIAAYMSESFPADVRGTSVAATYAIGRIGAILAPMFIGFMAAEYSIGYGISILGGAYAVCALIPGLFIKEKAYDPGKAET